MNYIHNLLKLPHNLNFGGKAKALNILMKNKVPVPEGYAISTEAFENGTLCTKAETELAELIKTLPRKYNYAVRSSAIGEDGAKVSFAGAYDTVLNITTDKILDAVRTVVASANNVRSEIYAQSRGTQKGNIGIVIQRFVSPKYAGVLFTADPITAEMGYMSGNFVCGMG